jgi:hypothetical protein
MAYDVNAIANAFIKLVNKDGHKKLTNMQLQFWV